MWLAFYNPTAVGDVLLLTSGPLDKAFAQVERRENVAVIQDKRTGQVVSINVFDVSNALELTGNGQITLTLDQEAQVNRMIQAAGFSEKVELERTPKFVVGRVETCVDHADSDHLHVTTIFDGIETLQIVCGAANIEAGQHVLIAKVGAVMPTGAIIWEGELRGVASYGMVCSTRELELTHLENEPGIWVLPTHFEAGTPLETVIANW